MLSVDDFSQKGGANGVDKVEAKSPLRGSLRVLIAALFVVEGRFFKKEVAPKFGRIDATFFDNFRVDLRCGYCGR